MNVKMKNSPMVNALLALNNSDVLHEFGKLNKKLEINAVGGFALIANGIRPDVNQKTDIDFIGEDLPDEIKIMTNEIGEDYGLERDWINNDVLLPGSTLEDLEKTTGKLHFNTFLDLENIKVNVLCAEDLLKLKMLALDTSLMAVSGNGDFTRAKDLKDIVLLKEYLNLDYIGIEEVCEELYICDDVYDLLSAYEYGGMEAVDDFIDEYIKQEPEMEMI